MHPSAPFIAIANYLLSDFMPENGSTGAPCASFSRSHRLDVDGRIEFWLGSHNNTLPAEQMWRSPESARPTCDVRPDMLEERRKTRPPCQVRVPFGSVLLRDVRVRISSTSPLISGE